MINVWVFHFKFLTFLLNVLQDEPFSSKLTLRFFPPVLSSIESIVSLLQHELWEWLSLEQCVEVTYLLPTVKEVETSVQGQQCHLLLKWHCCMWAPLNKGLDLTFQYPFQWLWKWSHPLFTCPLLCLSCDRNLSDRVGVTFCCHIPVLCSHVSEPNYIPRLPFVWDVTPHQWEISAQWLETVSWSQIHRSKCPIQLDILTNHPVMWHHIPKEHRPERHHSRSLTT